jgi:hypothetical protein
MSGGQTGSPGLAARGSGFGPPMNVLQNALGRAGQYGRPQQGYQQLGAPQMGAPSGGQSSFLPQNVMQQVGPMLGALGLNPPGMGSTGPGIQNTGGGVSMQVNPNTYPTQMGGQQLGAPEMGAPDRPAVMPGPGAGIQNTGGMQLGAPQMGVPQMGAPNSAAVMPGAGPGLVNPRQQQFQQFMGQFNPIAQFLKGR